MGAPATNQVSLRDRLGSLAVLVLLAVALAAISPSRSWAASGDADAGPPTAATAEEGSPPAAASCQTGGRLLAVGQYAEARKAYVGAVADDGEGECARAGIEAVGRAEATADCSRGDHYRDLGRDDDAAAAYEAALEIEPELSCATDGLDAIAPSWPTRAVEWLGEALVVLGLALGAFFLLIQFGRIRQVRRLLLPIPLIGRLVSPRLSVEALAEEVVEGKPGAPLGAKIKKAMRETWDEATSADPPSYELGRVSPRQELADLASDDPAVKNGLEKASSLSEQTKLVAGLLNLLYVLLPIRRFALTATLSPPGSEAEATLLLERDARLVATTTLAVPAADESAKAGDYVRLAAPAAVWAEYEVARLLAGHPPNADEALSYVALREGQDAAAADPKRGRACFQRAVLLNRRSWAAYVGMAAIDHGAKETYLRSLETLEYAMEEMRERYDEEGSPLGGRAHLGDSNYYQMGYSLASRLTNGGLDPELSDALAKRDPGAPSVRAVAERLIGEADAMVVWYRRRASRGIVRAGLKPSEKRMLAFLTDTVRPCMKILLAIAQLESDPGVARATIAEVRGMESPAAPAAQRGTLSHRTLYNLACLEASPRGEDDPTPIDEARAIGDLETAIRRAPGSVRGKLLAAAKSDPFFASLRGNADFERLQDLFGPDAEPVHHWWQHVFG